MGEAESWFICRVGLLETARAVALTTTRAVVATVRREWSSFSVIEVDERLVDHAVDLAIARDLRSLDALHLAAALILPRDDLTLAVWDRRLHAASRAEGIEVFPPSLE
jgi:predicted nucleic acid-binding protein